MLLADIKAAVNARLASLWPAFKAKQEAYRATHGRYWQGLPLLAAVPDDGVTVAPTLTVAPNDCYHTIEQGTETVPAMDGGTTQVPKRVRVPHDWTFLGAALPAQVEAQFTCDVYCAPGGIHGYYLTARVSRLGKTYRRTAHVLDGVEQTTGTWSIEA